MLLSAWAKSLGQMSLRSVAAKNERWGLNLSGRDQRAFYAATNTVFRVRARHLSFLSTPREKTEIMHQATLTSDPRLQQRYKSTEFLSWNTEAFNDGQLCFFRIDRLVKPFDRGNFPVFFRADCMQGANKYQLAHCELTKLIFPRSVDT